jgi:tRNA (Thr-GGU) A37 N-methylase
MPAVGIFSQRVKDRPNPIGVTAVVILSAEGNTLRVRGLDAIDGTPCGTSSPIFRSTT